MKTAASQTAIRLKSIFLVSLLSGVLAFSATAVEKKSAKTVTSKTAPSPKKKPVKKIPIKKVTEEPAVSTFIMPVEGFLTQRVPAFNQALFSAESLCKGPPSELHQFQPGAVEWLKFFSNAPDKKLILFFRMPEPQIAAIQGCLQVKGIDTTTVQWINLTDDENRQRHKDAFFLPFIQTVGKNTVTLLLDQQSENFLSETLLKEKADYLAAAIKIGKSYFAFPKFEQAVQGKAAAQRHRNFAQVQNSFPATEKDWLRDRFKLPWLTYAWARARALNEPLKQPQDSDLAVWTEKGLKLVEGQDLGSYYSWVIQKSDGRDKVVGCDETDFLTESLVKHHSVDVCVEKLKTVAAWDFDPLRMCMIFTESGARVKVHKDPEICGTRYLLKLTTESSQQFETREFPEIPEFQSHQEWLNWIQLHVKKPDDQHPFEYYFQMKEPQLNYQWGHCEDPSGRVLKTDANGYMVPECTPDVLYSWGPQVKLDYLIQHIGSETWSSEIRMLFLVRSALATFGYGELPVRIKLKPGTKLKVIDWRPDCSALQESNTVYLNYWGGSDFLICRPDVIESWSVVNETLYDEVIADYKYMVASGRSPRTIELYHFSHVCVDSNHPENSSIFQSNWDSHCFSYDCFLNELKFLRTQIALKRHSKIYWNPSVPPHERTPRRHFQTNVPSHFHQFH